MDIADYILKHSTTNPDYPAIEDGDRVITYQQLAILAQNAAANIAANGIGPGDIVALLLSDSADHLIVMCGLTLVGAVIWPIEITTVPRDLDRFLCEIPCKALINNGSQGLTQPVTQIDMSEITAPAESVFTRISRTADAPAVLVQSSGTTGRPKLAYFSAQQLIDSVETENPGRIWKQTCRSLSLLAMSLNTGCRYSLRFLIAGATIVVNRATSDLALLQLVKGARIDYLIMVPPQMRLMLKLARKKEMLFPDLTVAAMISGALTQEELANALKTVAPRIDVYYGTNECGNIAIASNEDHLNYPGSAGKPVEGFDVEVVDDHAHQVPTGEIGVLRLRAPHLPSAYINNPTANQQQFREGWHYPGDLALISDTGHIYLKGRADDRISRSGIKFYPQEIEQTLLSHPEVIDAAVVGWPDSASGEVAVAFLVVKDPSSMEQITTFCDTHLSPIKRPKRIILLDQLPKNPAGKVLKRELKDRYKQHQTASQA